MPPASPENPRRISSICFVKPYQIFGFHWKLSGSESETVSQYFNSHEPTNFDLIRKSAPMKVTEVSADKRIIKVGFAVKRKEENGEISITGV